ncbi:MAG: DUF6090 family protein [Flavobacteriaceae bacterium]
MIPFLRKIRKNLLVSGNTGKYITYAIGEIFLVVIGILIALQINNWNEGRKDKSRLQTNIKSISEDIQADIIQFEIKVNALHQQAVSASNIVPVMESQNQLIQDSLQFILDFNTLTTTPIVTKRNNTWDFLNSSGAISEFPDPNLLKILRNYYSEYDALASNFTNAANPVRLELRKLKYELFQDNEHRKFFPTATPKVPNIEVYRAIFKDKRILPLCRYIGSTASYFEESFERQQIKGQEIVDYLDKNIK